MKLNIGCGDRRMAGFTGVDAVKREGTDIVAAADDIPLPDGSVDTILAVHLFEHFYRWEAPKVLAEWARLLQPGGLLIIEMPDLMKCAKNLIAGLAGPKHPDQMHMWGCYGDPRTEDPFMTHRWGWTFKTIVPVLSEAGFKGMVELQTEFHKVGRGVRDFRVEARRR